MNQLTQAASSVPAVSTGDGGGGGSVDSTAAGSTVPVELSGVRPDPGPV
jgi:hypothetical protein